MAESLDKKKEDYDVSDWQLVNVKVRTLVSVCVFGFTLYCVHITLCHCVVSNSWRNPQ